MPDRFDLTYIDKDGSSKRALVVHRSSIGALERIMAFLIEKFAGNFPLWLAPEQVAIIPVADTHNEYATGVYEALQAVGIRVTLDTENDSMGKKIRTAKKAKLPYFLVLGDQEVADNTITLQTRDKEENETMTIETLIARLTHEITTKAI